MRVLLVFSALFLFLLTSCTKKEIAEVYLKTSGDLEVKFVGPDGKGVSDVPVKFAQYYNGGLSPSLRSDVTDDEGVIAYGEVNAATYQLSTPDFDYAKKRYHIDANIQVVGGIDKHVDLNLNDYTTKLTVKVQRSYADTTGVAGYGVMVLTNYWDYGDDLSSMINATAMHGESDNQGYITFNVPTGVFYTVVFYDPDSMQLLNYSDINYEQGTASDQLSFVADTYW